MTSQSNSVLTSPLKSFSRASSFIVIIVGCLVLVGWAFDITALKNVLPGLATMKANTALAFVLAGVSLWLLAMERPDRRARRIANICAAVTVLIGLLTLIEYLFDRKLGIDDLLWQDVSGDTPYPGRMAPATAFNFLLIGTALLLLDARNRTGIFQVPASVAGVVAFLALLGYLYDLKALYAIAPYTSMALHTAALFFLLFLGLLFARPDLGLMRVVSADNLGAVLARRLLPASIAIPPILGWLRLQGERAGFYGLEFGLALSALSNVLVFAALVWWSAKKIGSADAARIEAQIGLQTSEEKFRALLEFAPDPIVISDEKGNIVLLNGQTEKVLGYSRDELVGNPVEILVPEKLRGAHVGHRDKYYGDLRTRPMGMGSLYDFFARRKDGAMVPVDIALSPVRTPGQILIMAIIRDITERKRAEQDLQARYEELYALHEINQTVLTSPDLNSTVEGILDKALSVCSFDIGVIRLLDSSGKMLKSIASRGYQNPENIREISSDMRDARAGAMQGNVLTSKNPIVIEMLPASPGMRTFKKEGAQSAIIVPVRAEEKVLGSIQLGSRTPRKLQTHEVRLLETIGSQLGLAVQKARMFEEIKRNLEHIQILREIDQAITSTLNIDAILTLLLEKIDPFLAYPFASTVMLLNREAKELQPTACRHLDEMEWRRHVSDPVHGRGNQWIVLETKVPSKVPNVQTDPQTRHPGFMRKHGLVSFLGVPLAAKGEVLGVLSIYAKEEHDFSDEEVEFVSTLADQAAIAIHNAELYEEMAKLAADLTKSNRVKDEFLSVMSHELRTPLNVVMGYAGMIRDGLLGEINHKQKDGLEKIINRGNDQLFMINNVLYATVLETEEIKIEAHEISLVDFLNQLRLGRKAPTHKELTLHWDYPPDLPVIKTDSGKLKQILQNLIDNAIKFTEKGQITISVRVKQATEQAIEKDSADASRLPPRSTEAHDRSHAFVEFKVVDTGAGIPKEALPIIFEKFRQLDSSETRLYGGVGLGLYIVKKLTELLGGTVDVESEPGEGSAFTVRIPCS